MNINFQLFKIYLIYLYKYNSLILFNIYQQYKQAYANNNYVCMLITPLKYSY